jgi:hypothetical protein
MYPVLKTTELRSPGSQVADEHRGKMTGRTEDQLNCTLGEGGGERRNFRSIFTIVFTPPDVHLPR